MTFSRNVLPAADHDRAGVLGHVDVLRHATQDRAVRDAAILAQRGAALDRDVALQDTPAADPHPRLDHAQGTDLDIRAEGGLGADLTPTGGLA